MYLVVSSSFAGGQGPPAAHCFLYRGTSLCLKNITFEDYVVGCLLSFITGYCGHCPSSLRYPRRNEKGPVCIWPKGKVYSDWSIRKKKQSCVSEQSESEEKQGVLSIITEI